MNKYLYSKNNQVTLYKGNSFNVLKTFPDESINCVVTSPPYWNLRDYGTATWKGGDSDCNHTIEISNEQDLLNTSGKIDRVFRGPRDKCLNCDAKRVDEQIGLENTFQEYVNKLVLIFREIKRVLKDDSIAWLNLGDTWFHQKLYTEKKLKIKDMIGIPWRVAFALQEDGWYLRQDIIWHKPAPMPESVKDRCTKSHEYIFMLTKSQNYYFNADAIKEPATSQDNFDRHRDNTSYKTDNDFWNSGMGGLKHNNYEHRNKRSVWSINTATYKDSHFAVFPKELPMNCIKAGTKEGDIVLDPFAGSGTTLQVAQELGRQSIGIDVRSEFLDMCIERTKQMGLF